MKTAANPERLAAAFTRPDTGTGCEIGLGECDLRLATTNAHRRADTADTEQHDCPGTCLGNCCRRLKGRGAGIGAVTTREAVHDDLVRRTFCDRHGVDLEKLGLADNSLRRCEAVDEHRQDIEIGRAEEPRRARAERTASQAGLVDDEIESIRECTTLDARPAEICRNGTILYIAADCELRVVRSEVNCVSRWGHRECGYECHCREK